MINIIMNPVLYNLDMRIDKTIEYCKFKHYGYTQIQNYLADGLNRYIYYFNDKMKLTDCIKFFYQCPECQERYDAIIEKLDKCGVNKITETVKLLLIHAVIIEYRQNNNKKN